AKWPVFTPPLTHVDAWTCLGHGPELHKALQAGHSGLQPASRVFPHIDALTAGGLIGTLEGVTGEIRLPEILSTGLKLLAPACAWDVDMVIGACSVGDLEGPDAGRPQQALERAIKALRPDVPLPPIQLVSTACSSGTDAVALGAMSISAGLAESILVVAFDSLPAGKLLQHVALGTQSKDRARPFDIDRSGTSFGEACAVAVLASNEGLRRLGLSGQVRVAGFGMSCDAHHVVAPHPEGVYAAQAVLGALGDVSHLAIGYINAHGSGTILNDSAETQALRHAYGENAISHIHIGGTKGALGHTLGATGLVEVVVATQSLIDGWFPPTAGLVTPDPQLKLQFPTETRKRASHERYAMSATFGFGGINSALLMELM
ncbi:hypothetical protein N5C81_22890, partial [Rhizobium pusense]|uniref:beta-ketoacyl synthase N-terminal-like domain-containing protein n=1 Tax=Agrobacterium pusense TaxID=648995 RepID=UPI00244999DA